jgi:hypothetical protein
MRRTDVSYGYPDQPLIADGYDTDAEEEDYVCEHCGEGFLDPAAYDAHDCPALAPDASWDEED